MTKSPRKTQSQTSTETTKARRTPKKAHKNLNHWDTLRLWVAAGGRCQICNKLLTESENTYDSLNLGERAHMIAQTKGGPRGQDGVSDELAKSLDNVMLLCLACHKEIDDDKLQQKYPVTVLQQHKQQHEERIRYLTNLKPKRTRVLLFTTPIRQPSGGGQPEHDREVVLHQAEAYEALLPDYFPDTPQPIRIRVEVASKETEAYWTATFQHIKARYEAKVLWEEVENLSVFALGKIPALAYLGQLIGDARPVQVFNVSNGSPQKWQEAAPADFEYIVRPPPNAAESTKDVLLLLSLSGKVEAEQYAGRVPADAPIYEISNPPRHQQLNWLVAESQLKQFRKAYQGALGDIQRTYGQDAVIHVLTAVPAAVAVEVGRLYRANSHPRLKVYNCVGKRFSPALTLGGDE